MFLLLDDNVVRYVESLVPARDPLIEEMEQYAKEHEVPIMELNGIEVMLQLIKFIKPLSILEIGTAIGYSAIRMAKALPGAKVISIERDEERYNKALYYIEKAELETQITVKFGDALQIESEIKKEGSFDCLFIDAAKGQYRRFFNIYSKYVNSGGIIISDNVLFRGMVAQEEIENKRLRGMVTKLKDYNEWLMNHPDYQTTFYPIGDGIAISRKR